MAKIKRALISVSDKAGIQDFAKNLDRHGVDILSTGGTASLLRSSGLAVIDVSIYTGFPEMMDGRIKTLHPKIHGAILGCRANPEHVAKMNEHAMIPIDMVVVNLYPFEQTVSKPGCTLTEAIEHIDIGGPAMIRAAAKNHTDVTVVVDPLDYRQLIEEMDNTAGAVSPKTNFYLASKAFQRTSVYDAAIAGYLSQTSAGEE